MTTCLQCGAELQIGDYPFCPHGSIFPEFAQRFDPIVVHVSSNGEYRFPAATDAPIPAGFEKREIRSIREADAVTREVNRREDGRLESVFNASEASRLEKRARNREFMDGIRHKLSPAARKYMDEYREYQSQKDKERSQSRPKSADFHMEVFAYDSGSRDGYRDERTAWKYKKS